MKSELNYTLSAFGAQTVRSVPHILENIFFSLDYDSFIICMNVNKTWKKLLSTEPYQQRLQELLIEKKENERKLQEHKKRMGKILYKASKEGNAEVVKNLSNISKVNVNILVELSPWRQSTPLLEASREGHEDVVNILLDAGALVSMADSYGITPLHLAAHNGHIHIVKILLDSGAEVSKASVSGNTPLHLAIRNGYTEVIKILLDGRAEVDKADTHGTTPLMSAIYLGDVGSIKFLVEGGADLNKKNRWGRTPLQEATWMGLSDDVKEFLEEEDAQNDELIGIV